MAKGGLSWFTRATSSTRGPGGRRITVLIVGGIVVFMLVAGLAVLPIF